MTSNNFRKLSFVLMLSSSLCNNVFAQGKKGDPIEQRVNDLMSKMTLQEKIGQLNQFTSDRTSTGPISANSNKLKDIEAGKVGSMLNVRGSKDTRMVQEAAMRSRLKIPLLLVWM